MEINEAKQTMVRFRTVRVTRCTPQITRNANSLLFLNLNLNITNTTFPLSVPRITTVDEWDN